MYGYVTVGAWQRPCRQEIQGIPFAVCAVSAEGGFLPRLRRRVMLRRLRRMGVQRCVLPPALEAEAARCGLQMVEVYPLRRALLEQMPLLRQDRREQSALLLAPCADDAVWAAASLLAQRVRHLEVRLATGADAQLLAALRRRYGLSAAPVEQPAVTVSFGGEAAADTICLGEDCARRQRIIYTMARDKTVNEPTCEQMLTVLWQEGRIRKDEIGIILVESNP